VGDGREKLVFLIYIKLLMYLFYTTNIKSLIFYVGQSLTLFCFLTSPPIQHTKNSVEWEGEGGGGGEGRGRLPLIHSWSKNSVHINFTTYRR